MFADRRQIVILLMGFSSGLPLLLGFSTLSYWLSGEGVPLGAIGALVAVSAPYSLKFLWAPVFDLVSLPIFTKRLGRRRSWLLLIQLLLILSIITLGSCDPRENLAYLASAAIIMAFLSASQDIIIDAYRIEILEEREQGAGAASTQIGYRAGLLVSGAGAIALSAILSWFWVYIIMAALVAIGVVAAIIAPEPKLPTRAQPRSTEKNRAIILKNFKNNVFRPFSELLSRPGIIFVLVFIIFYKYGDAIAGAMANPFYDQLGFAPLEIASVTKVFGVAATVFGIAAGGLMVTWLGVWPALLIGGILQAATNIFFALLAKTGPDVYLLGVAVGFDNFAGGLGSTALVAYLSGLYHKSFTGTQFALLTSFMALGRTILAAPSGAIAEELGWVLFFLSTSVLAVPGIILLIWIRRYPAGSNDRK